MPHQRESSVVRKWPLPIFPDEVGGCPFEVREVTVWTVCACYGDGDADAAIGALFHRRSTVF